MSQMNTILRLMREPFLRPKPTGCVCPWCAGVPNPRPNIDHLRHFVCDNMPSEDGGLMKERSAYNFLRDLLEGTLLYDLLFEVGRYTDGNTLKDEARRIINRGSGLCLNCWQQSVPGSGIHEDGKCQMPSEDE